MGLLISRFRRKRTTIEILEDIDKEINHLQRNRKVNQNRQKQFVTSLLIYSIAVYVIAAVVFFWLWFPDTWQLRLLYSIPLLIFPFLIWGAKKLLHWYFIQRISSNDTELQDLRERKNQILEDVMETETYKKAREILEKFDPGKLRKLEGIPEAVPPDAGSPGTLIHQRTFQRVMQPPMRMPGPSSPRPGPSGIVQGQNGAPFHSSPVFRPGMAMPQPRPVSPSQAVLGGEFVRPNRPPMARSVLPQERGIMDRLMDYLVGDGPENRYALVCWQCFSHNGMALKEEFEYLSFHCCYCYALNPARKQRPTAPRLEFFAPPGVERHQETDTSSDGSGSDDIDKEDEKYRRSSVESSKSNMFKDISVIQSADPASAPLSASDISPLLHQRTVDGTSVMGEVGEMVQINEKDPEFQDVKVPGSVHDQGKEPEFEHTKDNGSKSGEAEDIGLIEGVINCLKPSGTVDQVPGTLEPACSEANVTKSTSHQVPLKLEDISNSNIEPLKESPHLPDMIHSQIVIKSSVDVIVSSNLNEGSLTSLDAAHHDSDLLDTTQMDIQFMDYSQTEVLGDLD